MASARSAAIPPRRNWRFPLYAVVCGIALPSLVLVLDLEWDGIVGGPAFDLLPLRPYTSFTAYVCMAALGMWIPFWDRRGHIQAAAAGVFFGAAAMAGVIGVLLLPLSFAGVLFNGIGLLGLVPLFTAHVFWRAARAAWSAAPSPLIPAATRALVAVVLFGGACFATGWWADREERNCTIVVARAEPGDAARAETTLRRLRVFTGISLDGLLKRALDSRSPETDRRRAREAYARLAHPLAEADD